ncbi:MAG: IS4 family transposase [Planctomycetaceae bacterium]
MRQVAEPEFQSWPVPVVGGKYVRLLEKYVRQLRDEESHGNRKLYLDDVFIVQLLAFFNPLVRTLRTVEDFSQTQRVQQNLSIRRICKSTLSDFQKLADPQRLEPILTELRRQLSRKYSLNSTGDRGLNDLLKQTIAVDGTFLPALADVAWAVCNTNNHGARKHRARVDCHLDVSTWIPEVLNVPQPGESEAEAARTKLQDDKIYLYDRGFVSFGLLEAHYETVGDELKPRRFFVCRYKRTGVNSPELKHANSRPLTAEDRAAGVVSDRVGVLIPSTPRRHTDGLQILVREVMIEYEENGEWQELRLITNLLEIPAASVGLLYRSRWQVELFFRWFKSVANFRHLIHRTREGMLTHLYVTMIAIALMYLHTGYRPSKYMLALLGHVASGAATLDEIMPILRERERRCELDRKSEAKRRAKKKSS